MGVDKRNHLFAPELSPGWVVNELVSLCTAGPLSGVRRSAARGARTARALRQLPHGTFRLAIPRTLHIISLAAPRTLHVISLAAPLTQHLTSPPLGYEPPYML